jgi:hypothetical protein
MLGEREGGPCYKEEGEEIKVDMMKVKSFYANHKK